MKLLCSKHSLVLLSLQVEAKALRVAHKTLNDLRAPFALTSSLTQLQPHWPLRCSSYNLPTSGPLHFLFLHLECCLPQGSKWLPPSPPSGLHPNVTSSEKPSLISHNLSIIAALFFSAVFITTLHILHFCASATVSLTRT